MKGTRQVKLKSGLWRNSCDVPSCYRRNTWRMALPRRSSKRRFRRPKRTLDRFLSLCEKQGRTCISEDCHLQSSQNKHDDKKPAEKKCTAIQSRRHAPSPTPAPSPLEIGHNDAAGVQVHVRDNEHACCVEMFVGNRCDRAVGGFADDLGANLP